VLASVDGRIWKLDDRLHELYAHDAVPYRIEISPDGRLVASCGRDGSLVVFDLVRNRVVARARAHGAPASNVGWSGDLIWTAGVDGAVRWWQLDGDTLQLRSEAQLTVPIQRTRVSGDLWAAGADAGDLVLGHTGAPPLVRLELGKRIDSIDISPDARYVAASIAGEITIVDARDRKLATLSIDSSPTGLIGFVDPRALAVNTATALELVHVDQLDFIPF
jgi:WD40 repeat protein